MKLLVIASDIGETAPGIVYETLLSSLVKEHDISLLSSFLSDRIPVSKSRRWIRIIQEPILHYRLERLFFKSIGRNILEDGYVAYNLLKTDYDFIKDDVDIIVSFASCHHYLSTLLGYKLSRKYNKKWLVYSVDAIPAPLEWINGDKRYFRRWQKFINFYFSKANAFLSANSQMLNYQLSQYSNANQITGVLFNPIRKNYSLECDKPKQVNLLYTGGIYGPRRKESVLDGFRLLLKKYPDATFTFVGNFMPKQFEGYEDLIDSSNIILAGYTNELLPYYKEATILIDINAYFENDVFLSSKIVNYLTIKKPIISVTGANSPSRNLFTDDPSIIHCAHDPKEVYEALNKALTTEFDYSERAKYIKMLSLDTQIETFNSILCTLKSV